MTRYTTKQDIARQDIIMQSRIEVTESGARGDTRDDSRSSFLLRGSTSTLEGCGRHKGLTLFSGEQRHKGLAHVSTKGFPRGGNRAFTRFLGHTSTTKLETANSSNNTIKTRSNQVTTTRVSKMEHYQRGPQANEGEM